MQQKLTLAFLNERLSIIQTLYSSYPKEHLEQGINRKVIVKVYDFFMKADQESLFQNLIKPTINYARDECLKEQFIIVELERITENQKDNATFFFREEDPIILVLNIWSLGVESSHIFDLSSDFPENIIQCLKYFTVAPKVIQSIFLKDN